MDFAPRLLDILQSSPLPALSFFKSLPIKCSKIWAIYLLVLEKANYTPRLYTGSGTHTKRGARERLRQYDTGTKLPISSIRGLSISSVQGICALRRFQLLADVHRLRLLFVLLETTFTSVFWTVKVKTEFGLGMHACITPMGYRQPRI